LPFNFVVVLYGLVVADVWCMRVLKNQQLAKLEKKNKKAFNEKR